MDETPTSNAILNPMGAAKHYVVKATAVPPRLGAVSRQWADSFQSKPGEFRFESAGIKRHYTECFAMRPGVK